MRNRSKLLLAALTATVVLGTLVATASAARFAISERGFRVTWTSLEFEGGILVPLVKCPVTIEGSFHSRTISKAAELIGYVTSAKVGAAATCTGGTTIILTANLPWHIRYVGFSGTLPRITEIHFDLVLAEFLINQNISTSRASCLYRSTAASPMEGWVDLEANGIATNLVPNNAAAIPLWQRLVESTVNCPASGRLKENLGPITQQGTSAKITVTLVA